MATIAAAELAIQLSERYTEFLRTQTPQQLADLASGKLVFASAASTAAAPVEVPPKKVAAKRTSPKRTAAKSTADPAQIAEQLRALNTVEEGEALLKPLTVAMIDAIGTELNIKLTGVKAEKTRRVLNQAIGARLKYSGLRAG